MKAEAVVYVVIISLALFPIKENEEYQEVVVVVVAAAAAAAAAAFILLFQFM